MEDTPEVIMERGRRARGEDPERRSKLLDRVSKFIFVPGHGPNFQNMTYDELENWVSVVESMSKRGRQAREGG